MAVPATKGDEEHWEGGLSGFRAAGPFRAARARLQPRPLPKTHQAGTEGPCRLKPAEACSTCAG